MASAKQKVMKYQIANVDKNRLILCGLLGSTPKRSWVVQRMLSGSLKRFTPAQKMHIVATYFTPELPASWIYYQFERLGGDSVAAKKIFERIAYGQPQRDKFQHIGQRNLQFIGNAEIERYYLRRNPNLQMKHPSWAIPYFNDARKQGQTLQQIADRLGFTMNQVKHVVYDLCPKGMFSSNTRNPNPPKRSK